MSDDATRIDNAPSTNWPLEFWVVVVPGLMVLTGLLAATLLIDLLRAFSWLPVDPELALGWAGIQIFLAVSIAGTQARPASARQWAILGSTLAAAMIAAVLASLFTAFFIGWIARRIGHRLAGENSPWRLRGYRNTETNHKGRKT